MALNQAEFDAAMAAYLAANEHTIAIRRGLAADLPSGLLQGELYYGTDTKEIKVGHGDGSNVSVGLSAYPVGSVYISVGATSPATLFGGTWSAFGTGRVLVGIDATDTDFNASEKTGGAKTVTLDTTQIPSHRHNEIFTNVSLTSGSTNIALVVDSGGVSDNNPNQMGYTGGGLAHNNQMQYITCYMWKRTA